MPSLRSLGLDATLQERLLSDAAAGGSSANTSASGGGGGTAIRTSQSLLSRDPQALATHLGVTLPEALDVRSAVADAITGQSRVGRDAATVTGGVSLAIRRAAAAGGADASASRGSRKRPRTEDGGEDGGEDEVNASTGSHGTSSARLFHRRRPPPAIVGAVTALDMCIHTAITNAHADGTCSGNAVGTGSAALDRLLAPHPDLADDGPANRIYHSLVLPSKSTALERRGGGGGGIENEGGFFGGSTSSSRTGEVAPHAESRGVRLGYVTEVYGPTAVGKTQLALSVAAHASVRGWTVHYLAGGGGASSFYPLVRRLKSLVQHRIERETELAPTSGDGNGEATAAALRNAVDRVGFVAVADGHDALAALACIDRDIAAANNNDDADGGRTNNANNSLIIFDSASGCLSSDLFADGDGGVGAALVEDVAFALKRMARTVGSVGSPARCAVLVINGTVSAGTGHKAALGAGWNRAADVQVHFDAVGDELLEHQEEGGRLMRSGEVPGLNVDSKRVIKTTLTKHYGKAISTREDDASKSVAITLSRVGFTDDK